MDASSTAAAEQQSAPEKSSFLHRGMTLPFVLIVTCFAAWGLAGNLTDPLVSVFGSVFSMSALQASLVQFAYYGAYFALAIPAAWINSRLGYKGGVLIGLLLAATGGLLFMPASQMMTYSMFLVALFTLAAGLSILETSANPYVMAMGPRENATRRLNFAQSFNPVGSNLGVLLAAVFILPHVNPATAEQRASLTQEALTEMQSAELQAVMGPYITLALVYVVIAIAIAMVRVPRHEALMADRKSETVALSGSRLGRLVRNRRYAFGVVAQFFNVAA
ncbi:MFS transporter [Halomonas sp. S2151]|nr:MFS transporter [Halomonas sp. S2151]